MVTLEIDTEKEHDDLGLQIRELETQELLTLYEFLEVEDGVIGLVSDELSFRAEHNQKLESTNQVEQIKSIENPV